MIRLLWRWIGGLSAIGLLACGKTDSLIGAMDPGDGGAGANGSQGGESGEEGGRTSGGASAGGFSGNGSGRGGTAGGGKGDAGGSGEGTAGGGTTGCEPSGIVAAQLVRLTFAQLTNSVAALLGENAANSVRTALQAELADTTFPPLSSPSEGSVVTDAVLSKSDQLAQTVGDYVRDNFNAVTACGAAPSDACAQTFVSDFTERAYRRPASDVELQNILQVYTEALGFDATIQEAVGASVTAVLDSPLFVYRTEFGAPKLGAYEIASGLSYFLSNGPPDATLLAAASEEALGTPVELEPHIDRLLLDPSTRANLEMEVANYFGVPKLHSVVIDSAALTAGLRAAMQVEADAFFQQHLWGDTPLGDLFTSQMSRVNAELAAHYGLAFPPPGSTPDAMGFAEVALPKERSGLLTQAAVLVGLSRERGPSTARRGAWINATILCAVSPPPHPDGIGEEPNLTVSERENAEYRMETPPCSGCHTHVDAIGLALGNFDSIGQYRTVDPEGRPIDSAVVLPPALDGKSVIGAAGLANAILESDKFPSCLAKNFLNYALSDAGVLPVDSCAVKDVVRAYESGDVPGFAGLVRQIALSNALSVRAP